MYNLPGSGAFIVLGCICAVAGWGVIEVVVWLFSHINIAWG
ncbi:hypothetical protein [Yersinia kristensenii]|nr:hypothetical protein [Yersinia kristensenii]EEP91805.1 hypothetical protein ykris0001_9290 [Yersinia kristensenii ATCC 33638]SUP67185.1 Uncharacterised protein [Yersinia kristensenii]